MKCAYGIIDKAIRLGILKTKGTVEPHECVSVKSWSFLVGFSPSEVQVIGKQGSVPYMTAALNRWNIWNIRHVQLEM